jgi:MFS family permease
VEPLLQAESVAAPAEPSTAFWRSPASWLLEKKLSRGFWVFFTVAFFFDLGFAVYFFLFNLYLLDLHFNERSMGLIGGALTLGSVAGTLPIGLLARKLGIRPLLVLCFVAAPAMGVLRATIVWEPAQIGLAFLAGLAMCIWGVCFLPAVAGLTTEENRASAFGLIFSVSIGTSALGGVVCGYLPQWLRAAGFAMQPAEVKRLILVASCAIATLALIPLLALRLPLRPDEPSGTKRSWKDALKRAFQMHPFLKRFLPSMALWTAVLVAFTPFANVYLARDLRIPLPQIGVIFSVAQIVQFCMGLLTPVVFRRLGLVNGIVATQVGTAVAMVCLAGTHNTGLAVVLYLSSSATQWMSSPGLYNLLMSKTPPSERSSAAAMTLFCNALLGSGATALAGILFVRFGYPRVLVGIALVALIAAFLFKFLVAPAGDRAPATQGEPLAE